MNNYCIRDNTDFGDRLIDLGFSPNQLATPYQCEKWYNYCIEHNMHMVAEKLLVSNVFDKYFKIADIDDIPWELWKNFNGPVERVMSSSVYDLLDHMCAIQSKQDKDILICTSSPYEYLSVSYIKQLKNCKYSTWVFNPDFLNYYGFVGGSISSNNPLWQINYGFTYATHEQINDILWEAQEECFLPMAPLI